MSRQPELSQLCRLIDESLRPYTEGVLVSFTKEKEKDLLLALSQVFRQIKLWTHEFDCDTDSESEAKLHDSSQYSPGSMSCSVDHSCLTKIIGDLGFLLAIENPHVQHLVGNVLVVVSEFVAASGSYWDAFMHLLCLCLGLGVRNSLLSSLDPLTSAKYLECDSSISILSIKPRVENANWSSVAVIIQVLRNILKYLKRQPDDQLLEVYLDSVRTSISSIPWDLLNKIHVGGNCESLRCFRVGGSVYSDVGQTKSGFMFCGNLVQFFCSLVSKSGSAEAVAGCLDKHPVGSEISYIVPKILACCLDDRGTQTDMCISQYFRHKILMLMIRLSFQIHLDSSVLVSWMHLIHKYFQDLLLEPMPKVESDQDDCLVCSPFLASFFDKGKRSMSPCHLQRLAVFLFLRCCISLINLRGSTEEQCLCTNDSYLIMGQNWSSACCSKQKGLMELCEWLQKHLPANISVKPETFSKASMNFSLSFLQLYMHEDDILFEVLLQLFCLPFGTERKVLKEKKSFHEVKDDIVVLSDLFDPIRMFHIFLSELLYDHQILLDYLVSKDTGVSSAKYLLRCLRTISDSWNLFVEFSFNGNITDQLICKKRKVLVDGLALQGDPSLSLERECKRAHKCGSKHPTTDRSPFQDAMECLLSLKESVQNIHQKNLFPYNPEVLLRRLTRFQELCDEHQNALLRTKRLNK